MQDNYLFFIFWSAHMVFVKLLFDFFSSFFFSLFSSSSMSLFLFLKTQPLLQLLVHDNYSLFHLYQNLYHSYGHTCMQFNLLFLLLIHLMLI